jgi:MFS transporter, Spinster family, sphingosine-1-phosphate transporter
MPRDSKASSTSLVWWLIAFMWGAYFLNYCDRQAIFSMKTVLAKELSMSDEQLGLIGAIFLWVYGIGCPLAGQLADRIAKKKLVVWSLVIWSFVTVATGLAGSAFMLLLLRGAMGVSESLFMPAAIALTANSMPPEKRSFAVSLLTTAQIAGVAAGATFGGWMAENGVWRYAFFILGAAGVLYAIPYFIFLSKIQEDTQLETKRSTQWLTIFSLARVPTFVILCITFPVFVFGLWMLYSWLPKFLEDKFDLGAAEASFKASIYMQTANLIGLFSGGFLADWLFKYTKASRMWLLVGSFLLSAPCIYGIGNSDSLYFTCLFMTGFGLFGGLLMGNIFPAAFEVVAADARASAVGMLNFFGAILSGFAPLVVGTWRESVGMENMLAATSIAYLIAGGIVIVNIATLYMSDWERVHPKSLLP